MTGPRWLPASYPARFDRVTISASGTAASADGALVVMQGVNKWFGDLHVLRDIDLSVARGEVVVVIGPSGSGKSTLCRAINRLETIDEGQIRLDGQPLAAEGKALAALRAEVGMVFQSFNLFGHKTILENVTPACPPGAFLSINNVFKPSDEPYTEAAKPAGPAPITATSYTSFFTSGFKPMRFATSMIPGLAMAFHLQKI